MLNTDKELKLYYSIGEVADMFGVNPSLPGARQRLKDNKEATVRNYEIVNKLKAIKEELLAIKRELDGRE